MTINENENYDDEQIDEEIDFNEWDEADFADDYSDGDSYQRSRIGRFTLGFVSIILVLALVGTTFAVFPQVFNLASFNFVKDSAVLSQQADIQEYKKSVVIVETEKGKGSGFFYQEENTIITNHHVISGANELKIITNNGQVFNGELVASDEALDYAVIKIQTGDTDKFPALTAADTATVNEKLYIIGNPLFNSFIASNGTLLGKTDRNGMSILVIGGKFYKGNSGSPILNKNGQVLGILYATTKVIIGDKETDAALAIPIEYINTALEALK